MKLPGISLIFLLMLFTISICSTIPNQEREAQRILEQINEVVQRTIPILRNNTELYPNIAIRKYLNQFYPVLRDFNYKEFQNKDLKRQIHRILKGSYYPEVDDIYKISATRLKGIGKERLVCSYNDHNKCTMAYIPHIKTVFSESQDLNELNYYWREWREKSTDEIRSSLVYFVNYYKNTTKLGISKPSELWYYDYDDGNFIDELTEVMNLMKPFYMQFHAYVRNALNKEYGNTIVPIRGCIPHHLIEKVELQSWKKDSILKNPIPEKKLPNLQAELDSHGYTPLKIVEKSAEFFNSFGIKNLTQ